MDSSLRRAVRLLSLALLLPAAFAPAATKTAKFNVTATVQADCTVAATDLAFGNVGLLASNVDSSSTITITCTPTTINAIATAAAIRGMDEPSSGPFPRRRRPGTSPGSPLWRGLTPTGT